ncbi:hypothetical protein QF035_000740 [Streptomyces umbrinus]|uniref:DUF4132 domain-containing protein n=1 Tax=Streptomyces umbrinus TaxID=67370 RepID=A0ABU0SHW6_9ACTN|nr:DUF4132 domain-containing protein [Streptomyces umbrinus]MDQ1023158.1 hypothetical protein [Streptomyces umbrinus]
MGWLAVGDTYEIALVEGRVVARSASETSGEGQLRALPGELRDRPEVIELQRFAEWLDRHAAQCVARVDSWMVSSLPVPSGLLARVWPDEAWRSALRDLVVVGEGPGEVGFLRDADDSGGLGVVNLDGETVRLSPRTVTMPHPVLLPDLDELRVFAAELGVVQGVEQIHRAVWRRPRDLGAGELGDAETVSEFSGAEYSSWFHLSARAASLGYKVSEGRVSGRIRDAGRVFTASVEIGSPYYGEEGRTGDLSWRHGRDSRLRLSEVGPVAWSEGMRMAAALQAGRTVSADRTA